MLQQLKLVEVREMSAPICTTCKQPIRGPRLVINHQWTCSTCAYYLDKGLIPPGTERDR